MVTDFVGRDEWRSVVARLPKKLKIHIVFIYFLLINFEVGLYVFSFYINHSEQTLITEIREDIAQYKPTRRYALCVNLQYKRYAPCVNLQYKDLL